MLNSSGKSGFVLVLAGQAAMKNVVSALARCMGLGYAGIIYSKRGGLTRQSSGLPSATAYFVR